MPELKGTIDLMNIADTVQYLAATGQTGMLKVTDYKTVKEIYFRNGKIIATSSSNPQEYLGQFLISYGKISEKGLKEVIDAQTEKKKMLGKLLVEEGIVSEEEMKKFLKMKIEETIYDMFMWEEGEFEFLEGQTISLEMLEVELEATPIILEAVRRVDEWGRIRQVIPGREYIPVINFDKVVEALPLKPNHAKLLRVINGKKSVENIAMEFRSSEFYVFKNLFDCFEEGLIRFKKPEEINLSLAKKSIRNKVLKLIDQGQLIQANSLIEVLSIKYKDTKLANNLNQLLQKKVEEIIGDGKKVPRLTKTINEIAGMSFSPEEGFLISRINSSWDINSIIKISPIKENKARIIFAELTLKGIIKFDE